MKLVGPLSSGTAAGSAGSATANATSTVPFCGRVVGIAVVYNDSPPSTTDVTVATAGTNAPVVTLLTLTNANTNYSQPLAHQGYDAAGAAITGVYAGPVIADFVKITIAQADAGDSVSVYLYLSDV